MIKEVDARGRPCPQPVLMTKRAIEQGALTIQVLVDNEGAVQNVTRFAEKEGYSVAVERQGPDFRLTLTKTSESAVAEAPSPAEIVCETGFWKINRGQVMCVKSDTVGRGSEELGSILIKALLSTLSESQELPEKIVFLNSGVRLVCEGSDVIESLKSLESKGVEVLACGTCLNYFELTEKVRVGRVSNAFEILNSLLQAQRIVELS